MGQFHFNTNDESKEFCLQIVNIMSERFSIGEEEATNRINQIWKNKDFLDEFDIRYHEEPEFWAHDIYFGPESKWWKRKNDPTLKPKPVK